VLEIVVVNDLLSELERIPASIKYAFKKIQEMERCILGVTGWQQPLCMTLKVNPFTTVAPGPAAAVELRQFHRNYEGALPERMPRREWAERFSSNVNPVTRTGGVSKGPAAGP